MHTKIKKGFWFRLFSAPVLMFAFAYALVPLYDVFCELTGFNGTTGRIAEANYEADENRTVNVSFFSATAPGFAVDFYPSVREMSVSPGVFYDTRYIAKNTTDKTLVGQAVPSVAPTAAAVHFKKLECFCFNRQTFKPNEELEMTVRFVVEPEMDEKIKDISLSYNFFELKS